MNDKQKKFIMSKLEAIEDKYSLPMSDDQWEIFLKELDDLYRSSKNNPTVSKVVNCFADYISCKEKIIKELTII